MWTMEATVPWFETVGVLSDADLTRCPPLVYVWSEGSRVGRARCRWHQRWR